MYAVEMEIPEEEAHWRGACPKGAFNWPDYLSSGMIGADPKLCRLVDSPVGHLNVGLFDTIP